MSAVNNVIPFQFETKEIRVVLNEKGEPLFVAKDVCDILDIQNVSQSVKVLEDYQVGRICITYTSEGPRENLTVTEAGLYSLVFRSRKPEAKRFTRWVTETVLPSLRKNGSYTVGQEVKSEPTRVVPTRNNIDELMDSLSKWAPLRNYYEGTGVPKDKLSLVVDKTMKERHGFDFEKETGFPIKDLVIPGSQIKSVEAVSQGPLKVDNRHFEILKNINKLCFLKTSKEHQDFWTKVNNAAGVNHWYDIELINFHLAEDAAHNYLHKKGLEVFSGRQVLDRKEIKKIATYENIPITKCETKISNEQISEIHRIRVLCQLKSAKANKLFWSTINKACGVLHFKQIPYDKFHIAKTTAMEFYDHVVSMNFAI